ncbi:MAG: cell division protein ZapB [Deferribacterales bacterium]|nr:cell division protein ZapB [Deferribacterales bacterium]
MVKDFMELYDKLNLLEGKIDSLLAAASEAKSAKDALQREYDDLLEKYILLEDEIRQLKQDRDTARQRIESIIAKLG